MKPRIGRYSFTTTSDSIKESNADRKISVEGNGYVDDTYKPIGVRLRMNVKNKLTIVKYSLKLSRFVGAKCVTVRDSSIFAVVNVWTGECYHIVKRTVV